MLYLYAVLSAPPPTGPLPAGIGGAPVFYVVADGLACAASVIGAQTVPPDVAHVLTHQQVVDAVTGHAPAVPLRFGTGVADEDACRRMLARQSGAIRIAIRQTAGCVELALRVSGLGDLASPPDLIRGEGRGAAYLRTLARRERDWPPASPSFPHDRLGTHAVDRLLWPRSPDQRDLKASFLVRREDLPAFLADLDAFQRARPDLGVSCTGPWPPYSFSDPTLWGAPS